MKILFVAPWPPSQVRPRSLGLLKLLARDHDVHVVALFADEEEASALGNLGVDFTGVANPRTRAVGRAARAALSGRSLQEAYGEVPALREAVERMVQAWRPDVLHLNVLRTAHLRRLGLQRATVIDLDEFRSAYYEQLATAGSWSKRLVGRYEAAAMHRVERQLLAEDLEILVSGEAESVYVSGGRRARLHVVRTPVWETSGVRNDGADGALRVLFVGRLSYEVNVGALERFVTQVWPSVSEAEPRAVLEIVGARPANRVSQLATRPQIELYPDVPSVAPHYLRASVAVVPIDRGTGIQMKLIEAFAARVPIVASPLSARLAGVEDGRELIVASTSREWTNALGAMLSDEELRRDLGARGFAWYEERHSPTAVARQLASIYGLRTADAQGDTSLPGQI